MDHTLTTKDLAWLLKLHEAKKANQPSADIPMSVLQRLTKVAGVDIGNSGGCVMTRGKDHETAPILRVLQGMSKS